MRELRGQRCLGIENNAAAKKQIVVSRSFGTRVTDLKTQGLLYITLQLELLRNLEMKTKMLSSFSLR